MWAELLMAFSKHKGQHEIGVRELYDSPVCINQEINRRLSMEALHEVLEYMVKNKFADWAKGDKEKVFVYWRALQEVADSIFDWVNRTGRIGSVETVIDLVEDDDNKNESFFGLPLELVLKALYLL